MFSYSMISGYWVLWGRLASKWMALDRSFVFIAVLIIVYIFFLLISSFLYSLVIFHGLMWLPTFPVLPCCFDSIMVIHLNTLKCGAYGSRLGCHGMLYLPPFGICVGLCSLCSRHEGVLLYLVAMFFSKLQNQWPPFSGGVGGIKNLESGNEIYLIWIQCW